MSETSHSLNFPGANEFMSLLQVISELRPTLSRSERRVAEYVLENSALVVNQTLAEAAAGSGVSEPTVIRFCSTVGFSGYQDFRMRLAEALAVGLPASYAAIESTDQAADIVRKVFDHTISSLDHTRRTLSASSVTDLVDRIWNSRSVYFFGQGASGVVAEDAAQKAPLFGRPCVAETDPHQQVVLASTLGPEDLIVLISHAGRTESLIQVAEFARSQGAQTCSISGNPDNPLAERCDLTLTTKIFEDTSLYTPATSRLAMLMMIDAAATVSLARGNDSTQQSTIRHMKETLTRFREGDLVTEEGPSNPNQS